jgi:hypothetical protein
MAFFPSSSGFIINGGNFTSFNLQPQDAGQSIHVSHFKFSAIDDTEYSRSTSTRKKKKKGLGV